MADVTLVLPRPGEWLATATLHARWILFCAPLLGTATDTGTLLPFFSCFAFGGAVVDGSVSAC